MLNDLNKNDVISYWKLNENQRKEVYNLVIKDLLKFDSSLFLRPKHDYLNYCLNKSEFINSLDLRNMYGHGTQPFGDENVHYSNYIRLLKLFVLIIIKINDELCTKDDLKNKKYDKIYSKVLVVLSCKKVSISIMAYLYLNIVRIIILI